MSRGTSSLERSWGHGAGGVGPLPAGGPVPILHFQKTIFSALENDPLFALPRGGRLSLEKYRELNFRRCRWILERSLVRVEDMVQSPLSTLTLITCLGTYDWSLAMKVLLHLLVSGQR